MVRLSDQADPGGYLIADAVRIELVGDVGESGPTAQVVAGATVIADGTGVVDLGRTNPGVELSQTFTVRNLGTSDLTLGAISIPEGFSLSSGLGTTALAPGESTTFTVQLDAGAVGSYSGIVSIATNDSLHNPFDFTVSGTVSEVQTLDDGETGFASSAGWQSYAGAGYESDMHFKQSGSGSEAATWTFTGLAPGQYRVWTTWVPFSNRVTNAPYTILDGSMALQTVTVNQQLSPSGLLDQGTSWQQLGGDYTISGGTLVVRLSDQADPGGYLIADAVRIERVGGVVVANDSGTGFDSSPGWQSYAGAGYLTDMHFKQSGSGSETATWSFTGLAPGQYRVWTTWVPISNRVTNAPYTILDGSTALQTVTVNQQLTPSGLLDQGTSWQQLGGDYTITGSTLVVRLSDQADPGGYLIADAVRIEQVGGASMSRPIAQLLAGSTVIADGTGVMDFRAHRSRRTFVADFHDA